MELDLRVRGSMLEQDGVWKVFSYHRRRMLIEQRAATAH
jgi:hypothetical protein